MKLKMRLKFLAPDRVAYLLVPLFFVVSISAFAQTEHTLHRFQPTTGGTQPLAGLVADSAGNFYGTASDYGLDSDFGTIFEMSPTATGAWTFTTLYSITDSETDGAVLWAGLIRDSAGNLYGTTAFSGPQNCGAVFELTPPSIPGDPWTFSVLHAFTGKLDGCNSQANLTMDAAGNLYGTTATGGIRCSGPGCGVVFALSPPTISGGAWTETILHTFDGTGGSAPIASVVFDKNGALYGTTFYGGPNGWGTVFKLVPPTIAGGAWVEHVLYSFAGGNDGSYPGASLVMDGQGNLFGTAADYIENAGSCSGRTNCGRVFELSPPTVSGEPWTYSTIWAFTGGSDGSSPYAAVIRDKAGNLYGTAAFDGLGGGTVYELTPPATTGGAWTETTLYQFTFGPGGTRPWGNVIFGKGGQLFGTTFTDGITECQTSFGDGGCGTVFALKP